VRGQSPEKLEFLRPHGIEVRLADDVLPRGLFQHITAGSEIRYFSDIFRYAVLYEHGGLWMDTDVVLLRPFPFHGDHFLNLQWRGGHQGHFICGNVMYAKPYSRHLRSLYEMSVERFSGSNSRTFGDIGPRLLSDYVASEAGAELRERLFSPMFFNSIDWMEVDRFNRPIGELADHLNDERVFGVHLWNARTNALSRDEGAMERLVQKMVRLYVRWIYRQSISSTNHSSDAPAVPGAFVVKGGQLLQRWTNDHFLATPHRAVNRSGGERYALAFFCAADIDWPVAAVPTCVGPDKPPSYPTTDYTEYMIRYQQRTYNVFRANDQDAAE